MARPSGRVLVLDGDTPAALACLRSLARAGLVVDVAAPVARPLAGSSRYRDGVHRYPDPKADPESFLEAVSRIAGERGIRYLQPVTDDTMEPLVEGRKRLPDGVILAAPSPESYALLSDKGRTAALAERLEIPVPQGRVAKDLEELRAASETLGFPLVLKPFRSVAALEGDLRTSLFVRYAVRPEDLESTAEPLLRYGPVVAQEYVQGAGVGVEVLVDRGETVYVFQHKRLHEWPLTGGGSSLRESVPVDPMLADEAARLLKAADFHGVAMVEFKVDGKKGTHHLIEVNPRFWGSLPLGLAAGADFPRMLHDLLVMGQRPTDEAARTGVQSRALTRDVWWLMEVLRRSDPNPLIRWPGRFGAVCGWFSLLLPKRVLDVQSFRDPRPGFVELARLVRDVTSRMADRRVRRRIRRRAERMRDRRDASDRLLKAARHLLFVCHGNINRSPLAAVDLGRRLGASPGVEIRSAGLHPKGGRPADPRMVALAAARGVDLGGCRSTVVDAPLLDQADLIFVMDAAQARRMEEILPGSAGKTLLLGVYAPPEEPIEIPDPYGGDEETYRRAFEAVTACTAAMARVLGERDRPKC